MLMAAGREAGYTGIEDIIEMDGLDYDLWSRWVFEGPSEMRTQMLLAQIIQMISGFGGGRPSAIGKLLPYFDEMTGANSLRSLKAKKQRRIDAQTALVNQILDSKLPPPPS